VDWTDNITVRESKMLIDESEHLLLVPYYLQIQNGKYFFLAEANGTFVGKYELATGRLLGAVQVDTLKQLDEWMASQSRFTGAAGAFPAVCGISCNERGECHVAFFKDYLVAHDSMNYTAPLALIMDVSHTMNGPVYLVKHPDFSPWNAIPDSWAGIDGGFFCLGDSLYVNNSQEGANPETDLILKYIRDNGQWRFAGKLPVKAAESWSERKEYPYILLEFYGHDNRVFVSDGRMVYNVTEHRPVFSETNLYPREIIITFSVYNGFLYLLTAQKAGEGFDYRVRIMHLEVNSISEPLPFTPDSEIYTYAFYKNTLYFVTKGENVWLNTREYEF